MELVPTPSKVLCSAASGELNQWWGPQINLQTGGLLETDLCGRVCEKHGKQRVHKVYIDMDGAIRSAAQGRTDDVGIPAVMAQGLPRGVACIALIAMSSLLILWLFPCSVILDETFPKWESDRYNCALDTSEDFMHTQTSRGYGLGTFGSLQPSEVTEDEDMADDAAISSQPEPLIPYGGLDKYYLPPSPLKTKPAPNSASKTEASPTFVARYWPRGCTLKQQYILLVPSLERVLLGHTILSSKHMCMCFQMKAG